MSKTKDLNMADIIASVACYIVMVSNGLLGVKDTVKDATQKWELEYKGGCDLCPVEDRCALVMANK